MIVLEVIAESFDHINKGLEAESNASCFVILPILFLQVRPCDIQMRPRGARWHKFLQKKSGRQRSGQGAADIIQIGARDFQEVLILLGERKFPETLSVISS